MTWVLFFVIIFLSIIIRVLTINEKKALQKPNPTTTNRQGQGGHGSSPHRNKNSTWVKIKNTLIVIFVLLLILWVITGVVSGLKNIFTPNNEQKKGEYVVRVLDDTYIEYGRAFGYKYVLDPKQFIEAQFLEASQPYEVLNDFGVMVAGEKGEDVSGKLGYSRGNQGLRFRSTNGQVGRLKINIIK